MGYAFMLPLLILGIIPPLFIAKMDVLLALRVFPVWLNLAWPLILTLSVVTFSITIVYQAMKKPHPTYNPLNAKPYPPALYQQLYAAIQKHNDRRDLGFLETFIHVLAKHRLFIDREGVLAFNPVAEPNLHYDASEAQLIARALFKMAKDLPEDKLSEKYLCAQKGIFYLLKAFSRLNPTLEVLKVKWDFLCYCYEINGKMMAEDNQQSPDKASTIIQRAFRKHIYRKAIKVGSLRPIELNALSLSPEQTTFLTPPIPKPVKFLSGIQKKEWAKKAWHKYQSLASKMAELVVFRTHGTFLRQLSGVVTRFNEYLHSLPQAQRSFILVVPKSPCSNRWVTAFGLKYLTKLPEAIVEINEVKEYIKKNPQVKHLVYMDDAIYSGRQLSGYLEASNCGPSQVVIAPFYQSTGMTRFNKKVVKILGERMLTPDDLYQSKLWSFEERTFFNDTFPQDWSSPSSKVGVYFQHRMADSASTFLNSLVFDKSLIPEEPLKPYYQKP